MTERRLKIIQDSFIGDPEETVTPWLRFYKRVKDDGKYLYTMYALSLADDGPHLERYIQGNYPANEWIELSRSYAKLFYLAQFPNVPTEVEPRIDTL